MKAKRIICALLAGLMLAGTLASCAAGDGGAETTVDPSSLETEEVTLMSADLPEDLNFEGTEVNIISRYKEGWTNAEIAVEGLKGEPVNDAVFERNRAVEARLGIKINSIEDNTDSHDAVVQKVATAVRGGLKDYDIMAAPAYTTLSETLNGTFMNLRGSECMYLDLEREWWIQGFNEAIRYDGAQYAALGSMVLSMYRFGFVTVFNKAMFTNASQPFLYDYVKNGTWTLDKQAQLAPLFYKDDGNNKQDLTGDTYGFVSSSYTNIDAYWSACQLKIIDQNADNEYEFVFDTARTFDVADKLIRLYHGTDGGLYAFSLDEDWATIRSMFAEGQCAMASFRLLELENEVMRNMEDEFGVVPIPKYDTQQASYQTLLHDQFTVVSIPTTVTEERLDMVSATLEALCSTGERIVKPAYYEDTLRTKIAQDPQSAEMMNIIVDGVYIDAGILYVASLGYFHHELRAVVSKGQNDVTSRFKSKGKIAEKSIKQINNRLNRIGEK